MLQFRRDFFGRFWQKLRQPGLTRKAGACSAHSFLVRKNVAETELDLKQIRFNRVIIADVGLVDTRARELDFDVRHDWFR